MGAASGVGAERGGDVVAVVRTMSRFFCMTIWFIRKSPLHWLYGVIRGGKKRRLERYEEDSFDFRDAGYGCVYGVF